MYKPVLLVLLIAASAGLDAQPNLDLKEERTPDGYAIFATNKEYCPVSLEIKFDLENLESSIGAENTLLIPAQAEKFKVADLTMEPDKYQFQYRIRTSAGFGDIRLQRYDTNYVYDLPFEKGQAYLLQQGYQGRFSHLGENALDFAMPIGTKVLAAREGIVVKIVQHHNQNCIREDCRDLNNYVLIYHPDGTFGEYVHLQKNGARVKVGDRVRKGDWIALSGNTGWSTGPHLHFSCYYYAGDNRKTIQTLFKVDNGSAAYLREQQTYRKDY